MAVGVTTEQTSAGRSDARSSEADGAFSVIVAAAALALGAAAAFRFSTFDDEANAIMNASGSLSRILDAGLVRHAQFHPPLWELVLHGWLRVVSFADLPLVRAPAVALWAATLGLVPWALAPVADQRRRRLAAALALAWPPHLVLPFCASWYALAALWIVLFFGAVLRLFTASGAPSRASLLAVGAGVGLGYTIFAWPLVLGAATLGAASIVGLGAARRLARRLWLPAVGIGALLVPTLLPILARVAPMLAHHAGGSPLLSLGAALALFAGQSAPVSRPLLAFALAAAGGAVVLALASRDRAARGALVAGVLVLAGLALTNTLNDKRLLLCSLFFPIAVALGTSATRTKWVVALCAVAVVPAALGWTGLARASWLYPRWRDPLAELATMQQTGAPARALVSDQPAVAYAVSASEGVTPAWDPMDGSLVAGHTARWRLRAVPELAAILDAGIPGGARTADLIVSPIREGWALSVASAFEAKGWRRVIDVRLGQDDLAAWRHGGGAFRYVFIRLER
jgi:hypothetical protein